MRSTNVLGLCFMQRNKSKSHIIYFIFAGFSDLMLFKEIIDSGAFF